MNIKLQFVRCVLIAVIPLFLSGCVAVVAGGAFYSHNKSKELCAELLKDPDFTEKMKEDEYREYYEKVCKPEKEKSEEELSE